MIIINVYDAYSMGNRFIIDTAVDNVSDIGMSLKNNFSQVVVRL